MAYRRRTGTTVRPTPSPPHLLRASLTPRAVATDQGFLPHHYETSPRQMFYHTMLAFTPVDHGLAPFCVATGPRQPWPIAVDC